MPEKIVTRGIVLRETQTKEADKILTVLTEHQGKMALVARGVRRRGSKIAAASQLLTYSELVMHEMHGWYLLDEASTIELFDGVRQDVELLSLGSYFAEMTEAVCAEGIGAGEILPLLLNSLYALGTLKKPPALVKAAFELRLLAAAGYEPLVYSCALCGRETPVEPVFDAAQGVVLCRSCAGSAPDLLPLDPGSLAAMRHVLGSGQKRMLSFSLTGKTLARFARACETFGLVQLERGFRTLDFYKSISAENNDTTTETQS